MKAQRKRLLRRGGFTLVECIIAVAVFAALTMVVFMILTHAMNSAKAANESEEDLTGMIENIVGDDSYKKFYSADSQSLVLDISDPYAAGSTPTYSSDIFSVSYNTVSGYKNYMRCSNCGHQANNTDFMFDSAGNPIRKAEDFTATKNPGCKYVCPECGTDVTPQLRCDDCLSTGAYNNTTLFQYLPETGSYLCRSCQGTTVMSWDSAANKYVSELAEAKAVEGDANFKISGMYANAIKYGSVSTPDNNMLFMLKDSSGNSYPYDASGSSSVTGTLSYKGTSNHSAPGTYTLVVNIGSWPDGLSMGGSNQVEIHFPAYYDVTNIKVNTTKSPDSGIVVPTSVTAADSDERVVTVTNLNGSGFAIDFRLTNYESGFAFEYDYNKSGAKLEDATDDNNNLQGLFAWFGCTSANPTRTEDYITAGNGSFSVDHPGNMGP